MKTAGPVYVAVIPAYNEAKTIRDIASRTRAQVDKVIVIDDGSSDATAAELSGLDIELMRNERNLGKGASLWRGIDAALVADIAGVLTLDGDGQHIPEDISRLIEAAQRYPEQIVIGSRLHDSARIPAARYYANRLANAGIGWAAGYRIVDSQSGLRIYPADLLRNLPTRLRSTASFVFESEVLIEAANLGVHSVFVPVAAIYHAGARPSHFRGRSDAWHIIKMVLGHLIQKRFHLKGLFRSLRGPAIYLENDNLKQSKHARRQRSSKP